MLPYKFPEATIPFGPPSDLEESQVRTIYAYRGEVQRGSCEGLEMVVVAYQPDDRERLAIAEGHPIFLTCIGGLMPHFLTTNFAEASNPA